MNFIDTHAIWAALHSPHWLTMHGLFVSIGLLVYVLTTHSLQKRRAPTAAISWVLTIALVPYLGLPLYLWFGTRKLARVAGHGHAALPTTLAVEESWARQLAASMGQPPAATYGDFHLHADGAHALRALWELIDSARQELVLCTFVIGRDAVGRALCARLANKARGGVSVRLLIDDVGRLLGGGLNLRGLRAAGVEVTLFGPIWHRPFKNSTNLRNHRKMAVADRTRLWCGGRNFAAQYFDGSQGHAAWRDLSFDLAGPLALQAAQLFEQDWAFASGAARIETLPAPGVAQPPLAQVIASGPDQPDDSVHDLIVTACFKAHARIIATTPYFVPGEVLLMALSLAARRGVTVDLILPGRSNHRMADFARHRALRELAACGARIWQTPYMLHAKAFVIDKSLALAGSTNLDARSLFLNYEMVVAFHATDEVRAFAQAIEAHRQAAVRYVARKPTLLRDLTEGLVLWIAFQL